MIAPAIIYLLEIRLDSHRTEPSWILWLEWAALLAIVALATYLRYWRITEVPPGFNSDEAVGAMGALTTLREGFKYSYEGQGGGGALGFYFATVAFYLFGPSIATIRGLAAWAGVVSIFANYWAVRELFRLHGLKQARWVAGLSTLGMAVSLWHLNASRIAFAGIGVPFLMLPSVYFLWLGLNRAVAGQGQRWPFVASGIFLGALMYIYLSGVFGPPFYAVFFIAQWLLVKAAASRWFKKIGFLKPEPPQAYLTSQFGYLLTTALTAGLLLLPIVYVLLSRPDLEPGTTRASQAFFMNPQINQGDPWDLLGRSIIGNFGAYGISISWFVGQPPALTLPTLVGFFVFVGFLIAFWRGWRGQAAYLFTLLWFVMLLLPSILSPDIIPHNLRTIGATTPVYTFAAIFLIWLFELVWLAGRRWLQPRLTRPTFTRLAWAATLALVLVLAVSLYQATAASLYRYFFVFPTTNDAKAAYHVYAVDMANEINRETRAEVAFILPRNTAAGDVFRNFTTDFLTELAQPPAARYWVIDDERTLADDLTEAAAQHPIIRVVKWKTSKHTGADPKQVIPYYLEKHGHYDRTDHFEYFDIDTYLLEQAAPHFTSAELVQTVNVDFGGQLRLTSYALGNAGEAGQVTRPQAYSNNLLWLRLAWQKIADHPENLKVSALIYTQTSQQVTQMDKLLISNILQVGSTQWPLKAEETTYFLIPIPPATPPGLYTVRLAVYEEESLARLPLISPAPPSGGQADVYALADFTILPAQQPVDPAELKLALPIEQELLPGLTLVGFETLPGTAVRSGDRVGASLIWQAGDLPPAQDLEMALWVKPTEGDEEIALSEPVGLAGEYSSSGWQSGELLRGWLVARIPPTLEPGTYKLRLRLTTAHNPAQEAALLPIGEFMVEGWLRNFEAPQPQVKVEADFNGQATLAGYDISDTTLDPQIARVSVTAGAPLNVTLYWRAEAEFDQNYTAFVHLIGPDGRLYGQVDQVPGAGAFPTSGWLPGEYLSDGYAIPVAANAPAGDYQLEIGWYNPETGQRLAVQSLNGQPYQDDKVLLPGLTVK
jgi:4-amino-4-deoxy-L-arabinose transferase-like glycosyltransferase